MPVNYPRSMIHISFVIFYEHPFCHCCAPACLSNWDIWPGNSVLTWESENKSNSHLPGHHVPYLYYLLLYLPRRDRDRRMEVKQCEWSFGVSANLFINQLGAYSVRVSLIEGKERFVPSFILLWINHHPPVHEEMCPIWLTLGRTVVAVQYLLTYYPHRVN